MRHFALGLIRISEKGESVDVDPRDWCAKTKEDLLLLIMACELQGEYEIMEFVEADDCEECPEEDNWTYEDELRERKMLN